MYVIVVYDIWKNKNTKLHKYLKKRLHWIQNSVFEWELSKSELVRLKKEISNMIKEFNKGNKDIQDSVIIFTTTHTKVLEKEIIWIEKNPTDNFI